MSIVHEWRFNGNALDSVRTNSMDGTVSGTSYSSTVTKLYGQSIYIPNFTSVTLPHTNVMQYTNFSITMWVKTNTEGGLDKTLFMEGSAADTTPFIDFNHNFGNLRYFIRRNTGAVIFNTSSADTPFDNTWRFYSLVDANGVVNAYVDGVSKISGSYSRAAVGTSVAAIGAAYRTSINKWLNGYTQNVRIYDEALSLPQLNAIQQADLANTAAFGSNW